MHDVMPAGWGFPTRYVARPKTRASASIAAGKPIRIAYWLGSLNYVPDVEEIVQEWNVSRATAYRWRAFAAKH